VKALNTSRLITAVLAMTALVALPRAAICMPVNSTNAIIELGDDIYIPLQPATSGMLGDLVGAGPYQHVVGIDPDYVTLSATNPSTSGYVTMMVNFDISGELTEEHPFVDQNSEMPLTLVLNDLDFAPTTELGGKLIFSEALEIMLLDADGQAVSGAAPLLLNAGNYLNYRQDVDGQGQQVVATDHVTGIYEIAIAGMFGQDGSARAAFIDSLNEDEAFGLMLTFYANVEYAGSRRVRYYNTSEAMDGSSVIFGVAAPEPATLAVLLVGGALVTLRRRRREHVSTAVRAKA